MKVTYFSFQSLITLAVVSVLALATLVVIPVHAEGFCSANVSQDSASAASVDQYTFNISNTGSMPIQWVDIAVPSEYYTYLGNSITDWTSFDNDFGTTLTNGSIAVNGTAELEITVSAGVRLTGLANWKIRASTAANGDNAADCTGDLGTAIDRYPPNYDQNAISNLLVSSISHSSVTISWNSDFLTNGIIYYGRTANYSNSSTYYPDHTSSHSITLTGLTSGSGYHFQVIGNDAGGNAAYSADSTFITASAPTVNKDDNSSPQSVINPSGNSSDLVAPVISLSSISSKPYVSSPQLSGIATDNTAISSVEYSTDGGKNWLPADMQPASPNAKVTYSFTPLIGQDGNYYIVARATDTAGNTTMTASQLMILDRLAPIVGGSIVSIGPQIVSPDTNGTIRALSGVDMKLTLSAVGGATAISIRAINQQSDDIHTQNFSMTFIQDTGLWSGLLSFTKPGFYKLTATSIDGAGNTTTKSLIDANVSSSGLTHDSTSNDPVSSKVTVHFKEPDSGHWVVWDGKAFGQENPQKTDTRPGRTGQFSMLLPAGTYYLKAESPNYHTYLSSIFSVQEPTPLSTELSLKPKKGFKLGSIILSLPNFSVQRADLKVPPSTIADEEELTGKPAPDFILSDTNETIKSLADLFGKPSVLYFDSMWTPSVTDQMATLSSLQSDETVNMVPIAMQDSPGRVKSHTSRSGVSLNWLVDSDGKLSASYRVRSLPQYYFLDRKGIVRDSVTGVLSEEQIKERLTGL